MKREVTAIPITENAGKGRREDHEPAHQGQRRYCPREERAGAPDPGDQERIKAQEKQRAHRADEGQQGCRECRADAGAPPVQDVNLRGASSALGEGVRRAIPELARSAWKHVQKRIPGCRTRHTTHIRNPRSMASSGRKKRIRMK